MNITCVSLKPRCILLFIWNYELKVSLPMPGLNCYCAETVAPLGRPVGSQLDSRKDNKGKKKKRKGKRNSVPYWRNVFVYRVAFIMWGCGPAATTQYSQHNTRRHRAWTNARGHLAVDCPGRERCRSVLETGEGTKSIWLNGVSTWPSTPAWPLCGLSRSEGRSILYHSMDQHLDKTSFFFLFKSRATTEPVHRPAHCGGGGVSYHVHIDGKTKTLRLWR